MPETNVGLPDNNLFGNLIASTRPSASNPGSQTLNINSIQSDTKAGDVEDIENADNIPFREILGLHIFNLNIHDTPNSHVPNTPASELTNIATVHPRLNLPLSPLPEGNRGKTFSPSVRETGGGIQGDNEYSPPLVGGVRASPVPDTGGVGSLLTDIELAEESLAETNSSMFHEPILTTTQPVNIFQKTFIPYPESTMQGFGNNLSSNRGKTAGSANVNIYNPFAGANNGHPSISPFVPLSQRESKWGFEERTGINVILDRHLVETHNPGSIFSMEKSNVNAADEMDKPFIQDMDVRNTLPKADTLKLNPLNNTEIPQISGASSLNNMQQSDLYSSDSSEINMKELSETYKLLAQNISSENKNSMRTPVINGSSKNTIEQHTESGLSKINGTVSSRQDVSSISQTNEDWNLFDSHTQKQNASDTVSFDTHTPKSNNGTLFSLDSQTTTSNAQSNVPDFQQNTKTSPHIGAPLSSSIEDAKTINHMFHSNDMSNAGHTHENIMEQIFQKIRITTHGDRSEIKLSLNPPELGNVKIHFTEESDEIEAKIFVENAEVKAAIENNVHRLKESVATNGIEIHKLEVYIQNNNTNKQESIENFNTNNPHHQNHTFSQNGFNEDHAGNEENMNDQQTEIRRNTSNLMVDYLI